MSDTDYLSQYQGMLESQAKVQAGIDDMSDKLSATDDPVLMISLNNGIKANTENLAMMTMLSDLFAKVNGLSDK